MRKEVKPAIICECCGQTKEDAVYDEFCDQCGKQINTQKNYSLHMTVWPANDASLSNYDVYCCSWKCVRDYLIKHKRKMQKIDFISLPFPVGKAGNTQKMKYPDLVDNFFKDFMLVADKEKVNP